MTPRTNGIGVIAALERAVAAVEQAASLLAASVLFAVMLIVSADVAMRYVFNRPFGWTYDLISLYLMGALFYFALSATFAAGAHVSVDVVATRLPAGVRRALQVVIALVSACLFATIAWRAAGQAAVDYASGAAVSGEVLWPTWASDVLVPIGCGLLTLRLLLHALMHALSLLTGRDLVPIDPGAGTTDVERIAFE